MNTNSTLARLHELQNLEILDTPQEEEFDEIVQLASKICNVPISLISLLDENRQWFKAKVGLDEEETPISTSFCAHAIIEKDDYMEVVDATKDERFCNNPLVTQKPNIRFYAGVPLVTSRGVKLGTLCVINIKPYRLNECQVFTLKVLSQQVSRLLEMRMAQKKLEKQALLLRHKTNLQKTMISIIAHDARSPLTALKTATNLLTTETISEAERKTLYNSFTSQLDNTLEMLDNLVEWGNMQIANAGLTKEKVHLKTIAEEILHQFQLNAIFKNNKLLNLVDTDIYLVSDKNMLRFILRNLVANAIKFTKGGLITLYAHAEKNSVVLTVSDNGIGMSQQTASNLFNQNIVQSIPGTNQEKGSGMGLLLTKDFVDKLNGTIQITSEPNKGTTVYLYFTK